MTSIKSAMKNNIRKIRYITSWLSLALMLASVVFIGLRGINLGLDFTGGVVTEVQLNSTISSNQISEQLNTISEHSVTVTKGGQDGRWILRYPTSSDVQPQQIEQQLQVVSSDVKVISNSIVGAQVGQDLIDQGGLAMLICMLCILGYLCFRFEWRLACGSLVALLHDVVLVLGFFAATQMEFNLTVFAAILAILGYSLNDSIIIADRIRELLVSKPNTSIEVNNDNAVLATFSRTMVTSGTTLITVGSLWLLGGDALSAFATAMFIGILSGTWSSISIGTVLPEWLKLDSKHYMAVPIDDAP